MQFYGSNVLILSKYIIFAKIKPQIKSYNDTLYSYITLGFLLIY